MSWTALRDGRLAPPHHPRGGSESRQDRQIPRGEHLQEHDGERRRQPPPPGARLPSFQQPERERQPRRPLQLQMAGVRHPEERPSENQARGDRRIVTAGEPQREQMRRQGVGPECREPEQREDENGIAERDRQRQSEDAESHHVLGVGQRLRLGEEHVRVEERQAVENCPVRPRDGPDDEAAVAGKACGRELVEPHERGCHHERGYRVKPGGDRPTFHAGR
jgi:hypothetical protein